MAGDAPAQATGQGGKQPYYICAPEYGGKFKKFRALHRLCSALNFLGYEAYVETRETSGALWTPLLTEASKVAHFHAGRKPIVVSANKVTSNLATIGLQVKYLLDKSPAAIAEDEGVALAYVQAAQQSGERKTLFLPALDTGDLQLPSLQQRTGIAFVHSEYSAAGGIVRDFGADAIDLSAQGFDSEERVRQVLLQSRWLYAYEYSETIDLARCCGCPVVLLPNPQSLKDRPDFLRDAEKQGIAWGDSASEMDGAAATVLSWRSQYLANRDAWARGLLAFVEETQAKANAMPLDQAWSQASVDLLDIRNLPSKELGARADRKKYKRVNEQYERWSQFCTLREIDADIYAEHLSSGKVPAVSVVIDQRDCPMDALADTLDSLSECLWRPANVLIVSEQPAPAALESQPDLRWMTVAASDRGALEALPGLLTDWVLLVQSGTRLVAQSLVEWGLATTAFPQAQLIYADEDIWQAQGLPQYPFFKPDANIELLRCTNYLGSALLAKAAPWVAAGAPLFDGALYGYALQCLQTRGRSALGHIDTVLLHSTGVLTAATESLEFSACSRVLTDSGLAQSVRPLERLGTWLVEYPAPAVPCVSLVVCTGLQSGYLRSLVESLQRYPQSALAEIVLVCDPEHLSEVEYALLDVQVDVPLQWLPLAQESYSHAAALNAGVAQAAHPFVLVCDDDTEFLHSDWLTPLLGIAQQADVACVAPRLMSNRGTDARVSGGPLVLGVQGTAAPYNGEAGVLEECGVQSRIQQTQDVSAVAGHCFLFRKADWQAVNGFDEKVFKFWYPVLDFCLRLGHSGKRHVWTPLGSVLHHGGKTLEILAKDTRAKLKMADAELTEKDGLLQRWADALAKDPCYNRHLSLIVPFDIENTIVIDWQPRRHDRPRVLACPLTSGAGQYRVVEPLNALQDAGLAQTCAIIPIQRGSTRILQPLELVRAAPDRLILQHSVDDAQLGMIEKYKLAMPHLPIIQMVDDLLGFVPEKHPNRNFQAREGHQRMVRALVQSDRLVVTTDTLRQQYQKYVSDVRLLPNCLDKQWSDRRTMRTCGRKLRVGWVGAGQHKGDLELVTEVVKALAGEVDWVFMGMCTDAIKPYIKEFHEFVPIGDYPAKMFSLDLDIAIAPLEKNFFNECKSNLRLLEYGAMAWPVVCSDVFPYQHMDPPVLRCGNSSQEWVDALRTLMDDQTLRFKMGDDLHTWVRSNFTLKNKTGEWMQAIFDEVSAA